MSTRRGGSSSSKSSATVKKDDLLSKEEEFKRLNAELEKKTTNIVYEAEQVLKAQERNQADSEYLTKLVDGLNERTADSFNQRPYRIESQQPARFKVEDDLKKFIQNAAKDDLDDDDFDGRKSEELNIVPKVANEMSSDAQIRYFSPPRSTTNSINLINHIF